MASMADNDGRLGTSEKKFIKSPDSCLSSTSAVVQWVGLSSMPLLSTVSSTVAYTVAGSRAMARRLRRAVALCQRWAQACAG